MRKQKKGISPVIATVLLIAIVIVLALIIFLWARGFVSESVLKEGENIKYACDRVNLEVEYDGETLSVVNAGNIPVYQLEVKGVLDGEKENIDNDILTEGDFNAGIGIGQTASYGLGDYDSLEVHPVLLGEASSSKKSSVCENSFNAEKGGYSEYDEEYYE